ncbi:NADPH-dependent FMN reductase [Microbacterium marinilacus]|uniref:NADPH-dependent FMN reductase n=1 Tax=Microbacterium marinilacus TaxID=415209 RepID=A0ABP7BFD1_9MICO|nr:NADPH-dependent FMN reductase [Microbacterium marinilacus]MBY0689580.1 NAD(P)H-dependent oxidoreductase [Microbacterium marinilacus]
MTTYNVGVLVGSLSQKSINRNLFRALSRLAPAADLTLTEIPIADLPLYNHDYDDDYPEVGTALKTAIEGSDAILLVTPEYNRSVPGALKNALDWSSRPWGTNSFQGKPSAVIGTSPGAVGTAVAQQHLRSILSFLASPELAQPEGYIQTTPGLISEDGDVSDDSTVEFLTTWLKAFHRHIAKTLTAVD